MHVYIRVWVIHYIFTKFFKVIDVFEVKGVWVLLVISVLVFTWGESISPWNTFHSQCWWKVRWKYFSMQYSQFTLILLNTLSQMWVYPQCSSSRSRSSVSSTSPSFSIDISYPPPVEIFLIQGSRSLTRISLESGTDIAVGLSIRGINTRKYFYIGVFFYKQHTLWETHYIFTKNFKIIDVLSLINLLIFIFLIY